MKVTIEGEYAAKSPIVGRRAVFQYKEEIELSEMTKGEVLFHARKICETILKDKDPKFAFIRTCGIAKESLNLFPPEEKPTVGFNPAKNFDPKTGQATETKQEQQEISDDAIDFPKPKRGGRKVK